MRLRHSYVRRLQDSMNKAVRLFLQLFQTQKMQMRYLFPLMGKKTTVSAENFQMICSRGTSMLQHCIQTMLRMYSATAFQIRSHGSGMSAATATILCGTRAFCFTENSTTSCSNLRDRLIRPDRALHRLSISLNANAVKKIQI